MSRYRGRSPGYSTDSSDDFDIRIEHDHRGAPKRMPERAPERVVHYVTTRAPPQRERFYEAAGNLTVADRTIVRARSKSRERRSSTPPRQQPPTPSTGQIVINNFRDRSESPSSCGSDHSTVISHRSRSHSHHHFHRSPGPVIVGPPPMPGPPGPPAPPLRPNPDELKLELTRRELEELRIREQERADREALEVAHVRQREELQYGHTRRELDEIKSAREREREERRREKEAREEAELRRAKQDLDRIRQKEEREAEEQRIRRELEIKWHAEEKRKAKEEEERQKAEKEAIERYRAKELERQQKEAAEKERMEKEYQRRLQEQLIKSGLDEKHIAAILKGEKVPEEKKKKEEKKEEEKPKERATYTRMARRYLSIETLRVYGLDFEIDQDPNYILIRRWVPEDEQNILWKHTKIIRDRRETLLLPGPSTTTVDNKVVLKVEEDHHHHHHHKHKKDKEDFIFVKKKRERSRSPSLLMYLAGAQPR